MTRLERMPDLVAGIASKNGHKRVDDGTYDQDAHEEIAADEDAPVHLLIRYEDPEILLQNGDLDQAYAHSVDCAGSVPPLAVH